MTRIISVSLRMCCLAVVAYLATATPGRSQDCGSLRETAALKLKEYLQKELEFRIAKRRIRLIEKWRDDYDEPTLLTDEWNAAKASIDGLQLDAEQAENDYDNARYAVSDECADDG